jgi:hypothetical protein
VIAFGASARQADEATEEPAFEWPAFQVQRFKEDYSGLRDLESIPARDWADRLKFIPLNDSRSLWLSVGGQGRLRYEGFSNFNFGGPADDDDGAYILYRGFLWGDVHLGDHFRIFAEGKLANVEDRDLVGGRRTLDTDVADMQNAFAEFSFETDNGLDIFVRGGRQELLYGKQRLISPLDWANTRRTFTGVVGGVAGDGWKVDAFWTQPVPVKKYDFNDADNNQDFWGIYANATNVADSTINLDAYFLGQHISRSSGGNIDRLTIGGRLFGPLMDTGLKYDLEGAYQFGELGDPDISAFFVSSELNYTFKEVGWTPWVAVGFDYASGDSDPTSGDAETFNQLFPLGHAYLGFIDVVGRQNNIAFRISGKVTPRKKLWFKADLHTFWVAEEEDALYNAGGGVVRAGSSSAGSFIGVELDLTAGYTFNHRTKALFGYSHFFASDFIEDTGTSDDIDFWYAQVQYTF